MKKINSTATSIRNLINILNAFHQQNEHDIKIYLGKTQPHSLIIMQVFNQKKGG